MEGRRAGVLRAHAGETEGVELVRARVYALVHVNCPRSHCDERALRDKCPVGEGVILHGDTEHEGCEMVNRCV